MRNSNAKSECKINVDFRFWAKIILNFPLSIFNFSLKSPSHRFAELSLRESLFIQLLP